MGHCYSLVHLTNLACPPPEFIRVAARAGYDVVSLRTIPLGLPGEQPYDMTKDPQLLRETRRALSETGIRYTDTEIARIADGVDVKDHEPALAAAAEMGVTHITTNIWIEDKARYTEQFIRLCELAKQYGQDVNVEFVTWSSVADLQQAKSLLLASKMENVGILVDALHFYRSRVSLDELKGCPREWFHYVHLCDCPREIPEDVEALARTGRAERLYPGEGSAPIREIMAGIPNPEVLCGLEVPNLSRLERLGFEEHARRALKAAKACLGENETKEERNGTYGEI